MEHDKRDAVENGPDSDADIVESGGETVAAATGSAEIGATSGETEDDSKARPVGADTRVKVEGEEDGAES